MQINSEITIDSSRALTSEFSIVTKHANGKFRESERFVSEADTKKHFDFLCEKLIPSERLQAGHEEWEVKEIFMTEIIHKVKLAVQF